MASAVQGAGQRLCMLLATQIFAKALESKVIKNHQKSSKIPSHYGFNTKIMVEWRHDLGLPPLIETLPVTRFSLWISWAMAAMSHRWDLGSWWCSCHRDRRCPPWRIGWRSPLARRPCCSPSPGTPSRQPRTMRTGYQGDIHILENIVWYYGIYIYIYYI